MYISNKLCLKYEYILYITHLPKLSWKDLASDCKWLQWLQFQQWQGMWATSALNLWDPAVPNKRLRKSEAKRRKMRKWHLSWDVYFNFYDGKTHGNARWQGCMQLPNFRILLLQELAYWGPTWAHLHSTAPDCTCSRGTTTGHCTSTIKINFGLQ